MSSSILTGLNSEPEVYPTLTEEQITRVRPFARVRRVVSGEVLYRPGDLAVPLYVLLSARIEVVQPDLDGDRLVTLLWAGMFTGEAGMIGGQRAVVQARATQDGVLLEVSPGNLRALVARDAQIGELLLRAFMLRGLTLISKQLGNVLIVGSRYCADTVRLREFLGRNGHPYTRTGRGRRSGAAPLGLAEDRCR